MFKNLTTHLPLTDSPTHRRERVYPVTEKNSTKNSTKKETSKTIVFQKFKLTHLSTIRIQKWHRSIEIPVTKFYQRRRGNAFKSVTSSIFEDRSKVPRYSQKYLDIFTKAYYRKICSKEKGKKKRGNVFKWNIRHVEKFDCLKYRFSGKVYRTEASHESVSKSIQLTGTSERERMVARF